MADKTINYLWTSDSIWWHISGSIFTQVMACCLTASSHYQNKSWHPFICEFLWHLLVSYFTASTDATISVFIFKMIHSKLMPQLPGAKTLSLSLRPRLHVDKDRIRSLLWCHNGRDSVCYHQPHECLLNHSFRSRSKKTSNLRVTGLCAENSPETVEFPAQMASNGENVSIWWRHHDNIYYCGNIWYLSIKIPPLAR